MQAFFSMTVCSPPQIQAFFLHDDRFLGRGKGKGKGNAMDNEKEGKKGKKLWDAMDNAVST